MTIYRSEHTQERQKEKLLTYGSTTCRYYPMALNSETYQEFERQLELQKEETTQAAEDGAKVKVDEDGTEYEWDEKKKAWFPKLSVEVMMKYQENYASKDEVADQNSHAYVDPATNVTFLWNTEKNRWEPKENENGDPCRYTHPSGIAYVWNIECGKWEVENAGQAQSDQPSTAVADDPSSKTHQEHTYTDPSTGIIYKWDQQRQLWASEGGQVMYPSTQNTLTNSKFIDPKTGAVFNWDKDKGEWVAEKKDGTKRDSSKRKASDASWFKAQDNKNTSVYVQGLPPDISMEEFQELMLKCGIIMPNPHTGKPKLKLYKDSEGNMKGDGLCCYLKKESLDLAMKLLDDSVMRGGYKISVQQANFELKGEYDPKKRPKMLSKKEKAKIRKEQEKMLDWKLAKKEAVKKSERVLIFKNMFDTKDFEEDATLITEIRDDLRRECEKFGVVKKVLVFDRHPDGVCSVAFKDFDEATTCVAAMNGRWFAKKKIEVAAWDGVTDYQVEENDMEREERIKSWESFLDSGGDGSTTAKKDSFEKES